MITTSGARGGGCSGCLWSKVATYCTHDSASLRRVPERGLFFVTIYDVTKTQIYLHVTKKYFVFLDLNQAFS